MKRRSLQLFGLALAISLSSCYKDDIEGLQNDLENLKEEVAQLEEAQKSALQEQIAALQAKIAELEAEDGNLSGDLEGLQTALQDLANEIASNEAAIFYGDLMTDGDYSRYTEQQATVVTGNVKVRSMEDADALADLEFVRGSVMIDAEASLPMLKSVFGALDVMADAAAPALTTVGSEVSIDAAAFTAPMLTAVYGDFQATGELGILDISTLVMIDGNYTLEGVEMETFNSASPMVSGNVYVAMGSDRYLHGLTFDEVKGDFTVWAAEWVNGIEYMGESLGGYFYVANIPFLQTLNAQSLTHINGDFNFEYNQPYNGVLPLADFSGFDALETVGGNFTLKGNRVISIVGFNNVTSVGGNIDMNGINGSGLEEVNVFNGLTMVGTADVPGDVRYNQRAKTTIAFEKLKVVKNVVFTAGLGMGSDFSAYTDNDVLAFSELEELEYAEFYLDAVTSFDGLGMLNTLTDRGNYDAQLNVILPTDSSIELCGLNNFLVAKKNQLFATEEMGLLTTIVLYNADWSTYPDWLWDGINPMANTGWINYTEQVSCATQGGGGGGVGIGIGF